MKIFMYFLAVLFAVLCLGGLVSNFRERFDWLSLCIAIALGVAAVGCYRSADRR